MRSLLGRYRFGPAYYRREVTLRSLGVGKLNKTRAGIMTIYSQYWHRFSMSKIISNILSAFATRHRIYLRLCLHHPSSSPWLLLLEFPLWAGGGGDGGGGESLRDPSSDEDAFPPLDGRPGMLGALLAWRAAQYTFNLWRRSAAGMVLCADPEAEALGRDFLTRLESSFSFVSASLSPFLSSITSLRSWLEVATGFL